MSRPLDETALIARAKGGDTAAYEELVRIHQDIAFRTACAIARSPADAEEVAQDAFLKAFRALPRFREGAPFRPWLLRIVANEARNRRRAAGRRARLWTRAAEQEVSGDAAPSPEATVLAGERRRLLLQALAGLREDDRRVLVCRFLVGLSEAETSAALGLRLGTVKSRTARALERLRQSVPEEVEA